MEQYILNTIPTECSRKAVLCKAAKGQVLSLIHVAKV